ncbi:aldolase/citrate lyase family protein [Salinibacterium sp. ZJ454]|uniref:HpcH/HpaI aldolase family protein n=1 Tax=Salinibacterium sp. ZJ454 TaxID=2708339 RepID=UPI00141F6108|nr:aldolase/citrate lyase family protein [Salinibacterium sp. ZJ454]
MSTRFQRAIASGGTAVTTNIMAPSTTLAEHLAYAGYDGLVMDLQHGALDLADALHITQAIGASGVTPLARIAAIDTGVIARLLDSGVLGLIAPMVESREEAERFVAACSYPPEGSRSFGPQRPAIYGELTTYGGPAAFADVANAMVTRIVQIETAAGLEHAEAIMSTPGLDGIYIGPSDLSRSLGGDYGVDWAEGPVVDAIERILDLGARYGVAVGIYSIDPHYARALADKGLSFVVLGGDIPFAVQAATDSITRFTGNK